MPAPPEPEPETTIAAKPVVNPEKTEAKPMPAPEASCAESHLLPDLPQPMPVVKPETTNMPASEEHVQKIVRLVLSYLEDSWSCKKIPGELFRRHVAKISGRYENAVWELLFPAHVVKLPTTDFFILRDDKHRPKGYEGLVDDKGILPSDEPALF